MMAWQINLVADLIKRDRPELSSKEVETEVTHLTDFIAACVRSSKTHIQNGETETNPAIKAA